jgi:hypothetical protein
MWSAGFISWKLYDDQLPFYDFLVQRVYSPESNSEDAGVVVGNIHRQFGKSFILCLLCIEFAMRTPGRQIRLMAPTQKALRKIIKPAMRTLLVDCPEQIRPKWNSADGIYEFSNGSEIHIAGANNGHADDARGQFSHLNVIDEAGFIDDLEYALSSVLLPQTLTTMGRTVIISTPPSSPAHELIPILRLAESTEDYFVWPLDKTTHISEAAKAKLIKEMRRKGETSIRRELYCEIVVDETRAVCPEFTDAKALEIVKPVASPTYEQPLVAMDVGFEDCTHVLFGFYDFKRATLCVQSEISLRRMRTDELASAVKAVEKELWPATSRPLRVSDVDLILLHDLSEIHGLHFAATEKDDKEAQVNKLRIWVQSGRIQIDPRCVLLIRQLKCAIWNKQRTEFERSAEDGHFDGVDALVYMIRNAPVSRNPYPALPGNVTVATHQISENAIISENRKAMNRAFGIGRK